MFYMKINKMLYTSQTSNFKKIILLVIQQKDCWRWILVTRILQLVGTQKEVACFEAGDPGMLSESESCSVVFNSLKPHGLHNPWNSPGHNTGVGSLSLLQGIFPTQGSNPGLPHCRRILYQLSHKGSPRIPEWVAYLFSSGSCQPRN